MKRSIILGTVLGGVMSLIFFLPEFQQTDSALKMSIPTYLGSWQTETYPPSKAELDTLAADTKFSKAKCGLRRVEEMSYITGSAPVDIVDLSIVLSGHDLANSIHRPERCMQAQGHRDLVNTPSELTLDNGTKIPLMRIDSRRDQRVRTPDGDQVITFDYLTYYFFIGHDRLTASHLQRTLMDITDRVAKGEAQRWAYISTSMAFLPTEKREYGGPADKELADKKIRQLLKELAKENVRWEALAN